MDPMAILEVLGPSGIAVAVCLYLHRSFVSYSTVMVDKLLQEQKEDRKVFEQAVDKLDRRLEYLEILLREKK